MTPPKVSFEFFPPKTPEMEASLWNCIVKLAELIKRDQRLDVDRTIEIVAQISDALMEAHAVGFIHRDLRPRNVMITRKRGRQDFVKLLEEVKEEERLQLLEDIREEASVQSGF